MLRVRHPEPPVGVRHVRHLDLPGVLRQAPRPRRPPLLRAVRHHGQVEGVRGQEDEGRRQPQGQGLPPRPGRLGRRRARQDQVGRFADGFFRSLR